MITPYDPKRDSEPRETPRAIDPEPRNPAILLLIILLLLVAEVALIITVVWYFWR